MSTHPTQPDQIMPWSKEHMAKAIEHLQHEFQGLRTGKASPVLVEHITVEAYGSQMRLRDVASISTPEPRLLVIQPWDRGMLAPIEKALVASNIGITPANDGAVIRLPIPELSEERRKKLTKDAKDYSEHARVSIRNIRRDANEHAKKFQKESMMTEDELKSMLDKIQKATDDYIANVDKVFHEKEKDLLAI